MKKRRKVLIVIIVLIPISIVYLIIIGRLVAWGPFASLHDFSKEVEKIEAKYNVETHQHGIVFYGASNFRLWEEMENDLAEYPVQNHGFGGSTDKMLVQYANQILYPYNPDIVFFQTGSNDYVNLAGSDEDKVEVCMEYKCEMFEQFHAKLPDAKFVVMSGLLLPGRSRYTELTQMINERLAELCEEKEYMYFVDASDMTYDGENYAEELFRFDQIHLNHDGQLLWCNNYIRPMLEELANQSED